MNRSKHRLSYRQLVGNSLVQVLDSQFRSPVFDRLALASGQDAEFKAACRPTSNTQPIAHMCNFSNVRFHSLYENGPDFAGIVDLEPFAPTTGSRGECTCRITSSVEEQQYFDVRVVVSYVKDLDEITLGSTYIKVHCSWA